MPVWGLNDDILNGYPHTGAIDESWYSYVKTDKKWHITADILNGYPYSYYRELTPPVHMCTFAAAALDRDFGLVGVSTSLLVTVSGLKHVASGDVLSFQLLDSQNVLQLSGSLTMEEAHEIPSKTYTFSDSDIGTLTAGQYSVTISISRGSESAKAVTLPYTIRTLPFITVEGVAPNIVQKPITADNNMLGVAYEILNSGDIARITNTFNIGGYSASITSLPLETLVVNSATQTSSMDTINFNFTVSDSAFVLKSFKFRFGQYNTGTRIQLSVDGTVYVDATFPMPGWVEYASANGLPLAAGSHTIKVYCPPSYFYAYSTSSKPVMPGMAITSGTVYAMEMAYKISSSGLSGVKTAVVTIDDSIQRGGYPVIVTSSVDLTGFGTVNLNPFTTGNMLEIVDAGEPPPPDPEIGAVSLSGSGRYIGYEIDITANVTGLMNVNVGDALTVRLKSGVAVLFEHTDSLASGVSAYSYTIAASRFAGLAAGAYIIEAVVAREGFNLAVQAAYTAVLPPTLAFLGADPNVIRLPIDSPLPITTAWGVSGIGVDTIQGSVTLAGFTASVNTASMAFDAVLANIAGLTEGTYDLAASFTATGNAYGAVPLTGAYTGAISVLPAPPVIPESPKDLRSSTLYIYNNFTLAAIIRGYISLKWVRRYNKPGEFTLQLEKTPENIALISSGNIIAKDNDTEAGFIEDINISDRIEARGAFVSKMLGFRVINYSNESKASLKNTVNQILQSNFISGAAARIIPGLGIAAYTVDDQEVDAHIANGSLLDWLEKQDIGFRIVFEPSGSAFMFAMYDGAERQGVIFSENYRNISEKEYFLQTSASKNVVYVEDSEKHVHEIGGAQGLERREAYLSAGRYAPSELGQRFLEENRPQKALDVKIVDPYEPFEYRTDYDVGDTVSVISEDYGVEIVRKILEITEYYDMTGFHLYIVFGDVPKTLLTELAENNRRLDGAWYGSGEWLDSVLPDIIGGLGDKLPDLPVGEELAELIGEMVDQKIEEAVPPIVDEKLEELRQDEIFIDAVNGIVDEKLADAGLTGAYSHVIIDHLPSQGEINSYSENTIVLVYDPSRPYTPGS